MISAKTLSAMEYDKILKDLSTFASLNKTKENILSLLPAFDLSTAEFLLKKTAEAYKLLYTHSISNVYYFDDVTEQLDRAEKGGVLTNLELLMVANNLKSARICKNSFDSISDEEIVVLRELASLLLPNSSLEEEITEKIISEDEISDHASPKLYAIRKEIRNLNAKIRNQLSSYIRGETAKYLQDGVITMRRDRYVIPVKSEYRSFVKGFIHDGSASGATVFIEPIEIIELNNQLKLEEGEEVGQRKRLFLLHVSKDLLRRVENNISEINKLKSNDIDLINDVSTLKKNVLSLIMEDTHIFEMLNELQSIYDTVSSDNKLIKEDNKNINNEILSIKEKIEYLSGVNVDSFETLEGINRRLNELEKSDKVFQKSIDKLNETIKDGVNAKLQWLIL
jgi:hypothetical protein